jgi:hypothetical protein
MVTSCDPIDPYTETGTFGVSYNGGYKPDKSLDWIPPDTNVLDSVDYDDFLPPPVLPPPNMLMNTREGRKVDPRVGTITKREMDFDDFTEQTQLIIDIGTPGSVYKDSEDQQMKLLALLIVILFVILAVTKLS